MSAQQALPPSQQDTASGLPQPKATLSHSSPGPWTTASGRVAAHLGAQQCTERNRPGPSVIAGHGIGHGTTTQTTDQAAGVAALDLLLRSERWRAVGLIASGRSWVPPRPWRCGRRGIVLNAASPAGLRHRPGPCCCREGKQCRGRGSSSGSKCKAKSHGRAQAVRTGSGSGHHCFGVWEEAREQQCSTTCIQHTPFCLAMGD